MKNNKRNLIFSIVGGAVIACSTLVGLTLIRITPQSYLKEIYHRNNIIYELTSYVEMSGRRDNDISHWDKIDFANRAGISAYTIIGRDHFDLNYFPTSNLEKALASYKAERDEIRKLFGIY